MKSTRASSPADVAWICATECESVHEPLDFM